MLVIPPNVADFTISRPINDEDSDEFILSPGLYLNDVSEIDEDQVSEKRLVNVAANAARVTRLTTVRRAVGEGGTFIINVSLAKGVRQNTEFAIGLVDAGRDLRERWTWAFSNGVHWNTNLGKIIVPPGKSSFRISIPIKSDNAFREGQDQVTLKVGGQSLKLAIINVPMGIITRLSGTAKVPEGGAFDIAVAVTKSRYMTSLSVAVTGNTRDIENPAQWRFTNGVKWNNDYKRFIVPANVTGFKVFIDTNFDYISEKKEGVTLIVGTKRLALSIDNRRLLEVKSASYFGWDMAEGVATRGSINVTFKDRVDLFHLSMSHFFKINFGGNAFSLFDWSFKSETKNVKIRHLGNGLFWLDFQYNAIVDVKFLSIKAVTVDNKTFSQVQTGWVYALGSNGNGATRFTVRDSLYRRFGPLPDLVKSGNVRDVRRFRTEMNQWRTDANTPLLNAQIKNYPSLVAPELRYIFTENRAQTIRQYLVSLENAAGTHRTDKMANARTNLSLAYSDLSPITYVAGLYRDTVLDNALTYLNAVNNALKISLTKAMNVRIEFATLLGTADASNTRDRDWVSSSAPSSISKLWSLYENKLDDFVNNVSNTFNEIRQNYGDAKNRDTEKILSIVEAVFGGIALIGSVGFFVKNFRAAWDGIGQLLKANNGKALNFSTFLDKNVNADSVVFSAVLATNTVGGIVTDALRAKNVGTAGIGQFDGPMGVLKTAFDDTTNALKQKLDDFNKKYMDMLLFVLMEGGAGNSDVAIPETERKLGPGRDKLTGFVDRAGYIYAWWGNPESYLVDRTRVIVQRLYGIPIPANDPRAVSLTCPIALDLTGDGLTFSQLSSAPLFDANHDGQRDRMAWVKGGTALLAYDVDHDGVITRTDEISFVGYKEGAKTDLEGLTAFDSNEDHVFDAHDQLWHQFGVWRDTNGDGVSQAGEFVSLAQAGITSISLISDQQVSVQGDVLIYGRSHFTRTDGSLGTVGDVGFRYMNG